MDAAGTPALRPFVLGLLAEAQLLVGAGISDRAAPTGDPIAHAVTAEAVG